jgi:hypothetical protein
MVFSRAQLGLRAQASPGAEFLTDLRAQMSLGWIQSSIYFAENLPGLRLRPARRGLQNR